MNQKVIRAFNEQEFLPEEADAWLKELDDRTKSGQTGYNSIDELASHVKAALLNQTSGFISRKNLSEVQALTGDTDVSYFVLDDEVNADNNGTWGFNGAAFYQAAKVELPISQEATEGNTEEAISSDGAFSMDERNNLKLSVVTPRISLTTAYIRKDNTTTSYSSGLGVSVYYIIKGGDIVVYSGQYGQSAVACVFLDSNDNVVGYEEYLDSQKTVNDLEITPPVGTAKARFCSLSDTLFKVSLKNDLLDNVKKTQKLTTDGNAASGFEVETATNPKEPVQKQSFDAIKGDGWSGETVKENADDLKGLMEYVINNNEDHTLNYSGNTGYGATAVSKQTYSKEATISSIYIKTGAIMETDVDGYLYIVDADNNVYKNLGIFNIASAISDTQYEIYEDEIILPIGYKIGVILGADLRLKYGASTDSGGFLFRLSVATDTDKDIGEHIFEGSSHLDFTSAISIGWDATVFEISTAKKTQKLTTDGNAISGFEVETATNPKEPAQLQQTVQNYFYGLDLCGIGDSMMKGHSLSADEVYASLIAKRNGMTFTNLGVNGNFLSDNGGSGTPLVNRVSVIPITTKVLIVDIGTNDAQNNVTIGLEDSTDITEFYGALNSFLEGVVNRIPSAKIFFVSPYLRVDRAQGYVDALKVGCSKYGIPVLDNITNGLIKWDNTAQYELLTLQDTYHFNPLGHLRNSYKIEAFMKSKF